MRVVTESFHQPDVERMKAAVVRLAAGAGDAADDDVTIDVRIAGGCPGQRVRFQATIPARGEARVSHLDELNAVSEEFTAAVDAAELRALARHLDVDALMALPPNADERYVPDSIVGSIVLTLGNTRITLWFPVDDEVASGAEVAMRIDPGHGPFLLRAAMAPPSVRAVLEQVATVVNRLAAARSR
jgi:hypothetical protein